MNYKNNLVTIIWSPNKESKFIKVSSKSVEIFEEHDLSKPEKSWPADSDIRSVAWHRSIDDDRFQSPIELIAVGYMNGIIKLVNLLNNGPAEDDEYCLIDREIKTRPTKPPLLLSWNPFCKNLLAQGIDKTKGSWSNEASVFIWELKSQNTKKSQYHDIQNKPTENANDHSEYCKNELVNSIAWTSDRHFICGISNKFLKLFDLQSSHPLKTVPTDAVCGLCCDYGTNKCIASFVDDRIVLWSEKNLDKPILTIPEVCQVESIEWNPSEYGYILVVYRERPFVKIINAAIAIRNSVAGYNSLIDQIITTRNGTHVLAATWNQNNSNCILIYNSNDEFEFQFMRTRSSVSISVDLNIVLNCGKIFRTYYIQYQELLSNSQVSNMLSEPNNISAMSICDEEENGVINNGGCRIESYENETQCLYGVDDVEILEKDISLIMKQRALKGYGQNNVSRDMMYSKLFEEENKDLHLFWKWIEDSIKVASTKTKNYQYQGVIDCIRDLVDITCTHPYRGSLLTFRLRDNNINISNAGEARWDRIYDELPFSIYTHPYRNRIFSVCGWPFNKPIDNWRHILEGLEDKERAASIAMVTLNFDVSLQYLKKLSNDKSMEYDILRLSLAGYNTQSGANHHVNSNWQMTCRDVLKRLGNDRPYLSLILQFLITSSKKELESLLKKTNIQLDDKIAIAALYLDDEALIDFFNYVSEEYILTGQLESIVMTGLTNREFVDNLMQNYVDSQTDIQTAAIAVLQSAHLTSNTYLINSDVVSSWIETYRNLMDIWKFWFMRADFDIANHYFHYLSTRNTNCKNTSTKQQQVTSSSKVKKQNLGITNTEMCQVYVACYYCGWKITQPSKFTTSFANRRAQLQSKSGTTSHGNTGLNSGYHGIKVADMHAGGCKATICQNCRKPLPRCSVCLMNMDISGGDSYNSLSSLATNSFTAAQTSSYMDVVFPGNSKNLYTPFLTTGYNYDNSSLVYPVQYDFVHPRGTVAKSNDSKNPNIPSPILLTNPIASWFMWCQTCKHGGHAGHLAAWFHKWTECPVTNCRCTCANLDQSDHSAMITSHPTPSVY